MADRKSEKKHEGNLPKEDDLPKLVRNIVASYHRDQITHRIGETFLPSRGKIVEIMDELRQLLFPGYFGHKVLGQHNIQFHVGNLADHLVRALSEQIFHCLCYSSDSEHHACRNQARQIALEFLARVPQLRKALKLDVEAACDGDPAAKSFAEIIYCYPGYYAITVYRIAHELLELGVPMMPRIMTEHAHSLTGTDIHPGASIGKRFFIDHATGVVIGETTIIGNNVKIYQGVTLGAHSFTKDERGRIIKGLKRHPTLEDNVTIYANATILGGETVIGNDSTVGGNVFLNMSVEPYTYVSLDDPTLNVKLRRKKTGRKKKQ